jgi:signal transduction histidine kinase
MTLEVATRPERKKRTVAVAVSASLVLVLFIAGLAFANSVGASRVAANAASLHWANATLGTSSLTRAALVQGTTFLGLEDDGLVTADDIEFAMTQIQTSYDELRGLEANGGHSESLPYLTHFLAEVGDGMEALSSGDSSTVRDLVVGDVETAYVVLIESLQTEQTAIQVAIEENTSSASKMNGYVLFILTLAIPATAVLVYWWIARRQVQEYKLKTQLELDSERAVSKAKDSFIAGLSHELRTPLTSIYGFAEILSDDASDASSESREAAQIIANEAAEMTRMVDDLLTASRMESTGIEIELTRTRLDDIVESAVTPFERAGLQVKRAPSSAFVMTDGARLRHVLVNLISNAARHGGSTMGIEISEADGRVDIEVWDNGVGVPEDQTEKLFERFIHNGAAPLLTGSVGLGLAVASRLTAMLGGRLSYQRFAAKTYFIVNVPLATVDVVPTAVETPVAEEDESGMSVAEAIRALSV